MTLDRLFAGLRVADVRGDLFRNIVSLRASEDLFDDLGGTPEDWQSAIALELQSRPATFVSLAPVIHRPFEEAAWNDAIGYPFRHWMSSRYSDGSFGVWYGADSVETTVFETVHHWRFGLLADAGFLQSGIAMERRVYRVRCDAALLDLRGAVAAFPALVDPDDYGFTHAIGARLRREGHPGLISRSARCAGEVGAVLNPAVLSDPRQHCLLTYTTAETGVAVEKKPGRVWMVV